MNNIEAIEHLLNAPIPASRFDPHFDSRADPASPPDARQTAAAINRVLTKMDRGERMTLNGCLSARALSNLYPILNDTVLEREAREHIVWTHFLHESKRRGEIWTDEFVQRIVAEYRANRYIAVESLVVQGLKEDRVTETQIERLAEVMEAKAFVKESAAFRCREKVKAGGELDAEEVSRLLRLRAFSTLDYALDRRAVRPEALRRFAEPEAGEQDRKTKERLFAKARWNRSAEPND
ncbi:hypothetical protein QWJ34_15920 [Saccharibacillus sp. CPCC 101409]|uniref:hypothetical protein n=1 Tax=Saccharibacillus sp. CPCC 101409 TaxID=3058041 RepID=UPI002673D98B|nr:hypothetical protein [Saccharibacillus sp. CPCC 101409]MDO3411253.1 hypothetical protein [Saccharibacillus sp. CPCC 101409]